MVYAFQNKQHTVFALQELCTILRTGPNYALFRADACCACPLVPGKRPKTRNFPKSA